jgi:hypothetical protein
LATRAGARWKVLQSERWVALRWAELMGMRGIRSAGVIDPGDFLFASREVDLKDGLPVISGGQFFFG